MTPTKQTRATEEAIEYVLRDYRAVFPDEFTPPAYSKARAALSALLAERDQLREACNSALIALEHPERATWRQTALTYLRAIANQETKA